MKLSLPYIDQSLEFWDQLSERYGNDIHEVYFPVQSDKITSGRPPQPASRLFSFLARSSLPKALLINPVLLPEPAEKLFPVISGILTQYADSYGITKVTVTNIQLAEAIKKQLPRFTVSGSVLMRIHDPRQIVYINHALDSLAVDTSILRDPDRLKKIRRAFSGTIKLMVNEGCLSFCPLRTQHFHEMGAGLAHPESLCQDLLGRLPWLRLTGAWILPQHLRFYEGLYDIIKIAGRVTLQDPEKYLRVVDAYVQGTPLAANAIGAGPAGMREDIPIPDKVFEHLLTCSKICSACNYCKEYYEQHLHGK